MKLFLRVLRLMAPHRGMMALAILLSLIAMLANIALMTVSGWFIAAMGLAGASGAALNYLTPAAAIRALAMARTGSRYGERVIGHEATFQVLAGLRRWLYDRLEPLAPAGLDGHASGDLLTRIRNDIERLELIFLRILSPAMVAGLTVLAVTGVLAGYHWPAAAGVLVVLMLAGVLLPLVVARTGAQPSRGLVATSARMKESLVDGLDGLADLKLAGLEGAFAARIDDLSDRHIADEARLARLQGLSLAAIGLAANFALLLVLLLVTPGIADHALAPADLPMLMLLAAASFDAVAPLPAAFQSLAGTLASAGRLFELADQTAAVTEPERPARMPEGNRLRFEHVSYRYPEGRRLVLDGIDLDLGDGRRIAVVGESGAGKSSLINLAVRFSDPETGRIMLGGSPIHELPLDAFRARIAVASQKPHLFAATVRDNLLMARPDATESLIEEAARTAQIHDFLMSLPKRYDTFVGAHGHLLSGGEARRLAVARALLKQAPILLLDEPTEGLDGAMATRLLKGVLDDGRRRSVLLVTHREAGLDLMDEIVILGAGRIVARGSYGELAQPGGLLHASGSLLSEQSDRTS